MNKNNQKTEDGDFNIGSLHNILGYQIKRAQMVVFHSFSKYFGDLNLTPGRLGVLIKIQSNPGVNQVVLAKASGIEKSTMGELIDNFEKEKLVQRRPYPKDRRSHALFLTEHGESFLASVLPKLEEHEKSCTSDLTSAEKVHLLDLLRRISSNY